MFLAEALKNSETEKEKCDAAGWEESESLSWQLIPWYLQTMLSSLCTYSSKILTLSNTPLFQSCVTLEETETKPDFDDSRRTKTFESGEANPNQPSNPK